MSGLDGGRAGSRRSEHRLVYRVFSDSVRVFSDSVEIAVCRFHYGK